MGGVLSMPWDLSAMPVLVRCGYFPMMPAGFEHVYQAATNAIHLYDYDAKFRIGGAEYPLKSGDITFSPARECSAYELARAGGHWCIHFHLPGRGGPVQHLPVHLDTGAGAGYYRDRFKAIATHHNRGAVTDEQLQVCKARAAAIFLEMVLSLFTLRTPSKGPRQRYSDGALEKLLSYIENHLDEPLSIPELSGRVRLSQNYLAVRFRKNFGMSIQQYIHSRRMESASHLLQTSTATIKMIGAKVGVPDAQHFNKSFRRYSGVSPSRYRETLITAASRKTV